MLEVGTIATGANAGVGQSARSWGVMVTVIGLRSLRRQWFDEPVAQSCAIRRQSSVQLMNFGWHGDDAL